MVTCVEMGEIPMKKLSGNKSAMARRAVDSFMDNPDPRWKGDWVGTGRVKVGLVLDQEAFMRLKQKSKKFGYTATQCLEIGIMALEE